VAAVIQAEKYLEEGKVEFNGLLWYISFIFKSLLLPLFDPKNATKQVSNINLGGFSCPVQTYQ
jgi:hypothetical protein